MTLRLLWLNRWCCFWYALGTFATSRAHKLHNIETKLLTKNLTAIQSDRPHQ